MQFKHPEILYALLLLLIPIIVHLFQLRRFQKIEFTNVAFLKKATLQTRKSSRIKKWLTLFTRLFALASIILAFAQPFIASKTALNTEKETVVYIDNSFSMQAKGANGPMLKYITNRLYENLEGDQEISWFTNDETQKQITQKDFKNKVLSIGYTHKKLSMEEVLLKAQQLFSSSNTSEQRLILLSDFQQQGKLPEIPANISVDAVQTQPVVMNNIAIDTAYIATTSIEKIQLEVKVSGTGELPETTAISLWKDDQLVAKTAVPLQNGTAGTVQFDIENTSQFKGTLSIEDSGLPFDNTLYFSINPSVPINVLVVNEGDANFTRKLFDNTTYGYLQQEIDQLNYSLIPNQNFIVLNELKEIPSPLLPVLTNFQRNGGSLLIIPSQTSNIDSYNRLLQALEMGAFASEFIPSEKKIMKINFSHPLFENVFEKEVVNFQYPSVYGFYTYNHNGSEILQYEDDAPFLIKHDKNFLFTAPLDNQNSNFKNSPLIVPALINMAQQSLPLTDLYFEVGKLNRFAIPISVSQDEILTIKDSVSSFIPLQQSKAALVEITTDEAPASAGNYSVYNDTTPLQWVSYNYSRTENQLTYHSLDDWGGQTYKNVDAVFEKIAQRNNINELWKWFVIFAIVFLLLEMLILKNFK